MRKLGYFFSRTFPREEPRDTGGGRVFFFDAPFLTTRWRRWRQGDISALRSAFVV